MSPLLILHLSYAIAALSFAVRDIFWLRFIAIASSGVQLLYFSVTDNFTSPSFMWHSIFMGINTTRIALMIHGENVAKFSADELELFETLFGSMSKLDFLRLMRAGTWRTADNGAVLARQGQTLGELILLKSGEAQVEVDGEWVASVRGGQFVGEMSYLTNESASATVTSTTPIRYLAWERVRLRSILARNPSLRFALTAVMGTDLSKKLRTTERS